MTPVMSFQIIGLAIVGGVIYFDAKFDTSERGFTEKIAFIFWNAAFWSVSTIYGSIVTYHKDTWRPEGSEMVYMPPPSDDVDGSSIDDEPLEDALPARHDNIVDFTSAARQLSTQSYHVDDPNHTRWKMAGKAVNPNLPAQGQAVKSQETTSPITWPLAAEAEDDISERKGGSQHNTVAFLSAESNTDYAGRDSAASVSADIPGRTSRAVSSMAFPGGCEMDIDGEPCPELRCNVVQYHIVRFCVGCLVSFPWPLIFAFITDALSQMAPSVGNVFCIGCVLFLTQQAFEGMGRFLAELAGPTSMAIAVSFGTIASQMLVIGGGFYRTVPAAISAASPIRYSMSAITMLSFDAEDSFWCTPNRALASQPQLVNQNGATSGFETHFAPSTFGAGVPTKTCLESRFCKKKEV